MWNKLLEEKEILVCFYVLNSEGSLFKEVCVSGTINTESTTNTEEFKK